MKQIKLILRLLFYYIRPLRFLLQCPMEISIIRHAQSVRNQVMRNRIFVGSQEEMDLINLVPDHKVEITEKGWQQATRSGPGIREEIGTPDLILTSGYVRTNQTLKGIKKGIGNYWDMVPVVEDLAIRERESGHTWRLTASARDEIFPFLQEYWDVVGGLFARPPGGESVMDVIENRLKRFIDKIKRKCAGKKICLVTHGRIVTGIRAILESFSIDQIERTVTLNENIPKNVGLTVYRYSPWTGRLEPVMYNKVFTE